MEGEYEQSNEHSPSSLTKQVYVLAESRVISAQGRIFTRGEGKLLAILVSSSAEMIENSGPIGEVVLPTSCKEEDDREWCYCRPGAFNVVFALQLKAGGDWYKLDVEKDFLVAALRNP